MLSLLVALAACAGAQDGPTAAAGSDTPAIQAAPAEPVTPPGGMSGEELEAINEGLDGGESQVDRSDTDSAPAAETFGPGLSADAVTTLVTPLAEAEAWLAELEVQWDNGMTYSEIFRAWRSVSAETGPVLAAFEVPADADAEQAALLAAYHESVQGAHDEWQATVDFIVTYITNYTPEILITKAYQEVEFHLRDAEEVRVTMGIAAAARPEIVIEELVDL